jgi:hypothetical protein
VCALSDQYSCGGHGCLNRWQCGSGSHRRHCLSCRSVTRTWWVGCMCPPGSQRGSSSSHLFVLFVFLALHTFPSSGGHACPRAAQVGAAHPVRHRSRRWPSVRAG